MNHNTANGVEEVALVERPPQASELVLMFERLAKDPAVDVEKLERLISMNERILAHQAKSAFDGSFAKMHPELPEISERGKIEVKGTVRSTYAKLEDIHAVIKPIISRYGFAVRHRTEWPADKPGIIRIVGILTHEQGHSEESAFEAPMDRSDYRTDIQSMGSTVSYGRRYTTLDLLNIVTRGMDKDGQAREEKPDAPAGYDDWMIDMTATADEGTAKLSKAWNDSKKEYREYTARYNKDAWDALKDKAKKVRAA